MRITLTDIGLIHQLQLDTAKDLLVFCGPNNTGKTYASYSLYGIHSLVGRPGMLGRLFPSPAGTETLLETGKLELDLWQYWSQHEQAILGAIGSYAVGRLADTFATPASHFETAALHFEPEAAEVQHRLNTLELAEVLKVGTATTLEVSKIAGATTVTLLMIHQGATALPDAETLHFVVRNWCCGIILQCLLQHSFIVPAERMAVQLFARELSASHRSDGYLAPVPGGSLKLMAMRATADVYERRYPLPVRDALQVAEDLHLLKRYKSSYATLAAWMEKAVLRGKIAIGREGDIDYKPQGKKTAMPLHMAASMVKSLAMLVLYLKHIAREGDLLILDEPELNLHPDNQVQLARLLGKLANSGIKILMTTHSDYIIRELNNLIMLGSLQGRDPKLLKKYGYDASCQLDYERVGAYMFSEEEQRVLPVEEYGFGVPSLDDVTDTQNLAADEIAFVLHKYMPKD